MKHLLTLLLLISFTHVFGQRDVTMKTKDLSELELQMLNRAMFFFDEENYLRAIPYFLSIEEGHPDEVFLKYKLGICYLNKSDEYNQAVSYLESVEKTQPEAEDLSLYLGEAYHKTYQFDKAIKQFNLFLADKKNSSERIDLAKKYLRSCEKGKEIVDHPVEVKIVNIGAPVNTEASEYVPVLTSDENMLIYTYRGKKSVGGLQAIDQPGLADSNGIYYEDVYISYNVDGVWSEPTSISESINGFGNDAAIGISPDGQMLLIYRYTQADGGDIYWSDLMGQEWSKPKRLKGDINTEHWEGSASLSADGHEIYFTSERPGGFGGRDIYRAIREEHGQWGKAENLGPFVNTEYNDDAPFIAPDGKTLIFSSEGHNSIGGYDIFSVVKADEGWTSPKNLGYPINSTDDDRFYVTSPDGKRGYYASGHAGGMGAHDIYVVEPGLADFKATMVLVSGTVYLDSVPEEAVITVRYGRSDKEQGVYNSNSSTGKYLINLLAHYDYFVDYYSKTIDSTITIEFNEENVDSFIEVHQDVHFYTKPMYDVATAKFSSDNLVIPKKENALPDSVAYLTYDQILARFGSLEVEGLVFKVQIAAYNFPDNFKYSNLQGLGEVEKKNYPDGITRFTIGGAFTTLSAANIHRDKVVAKGTKDAFVTAIYKGERHHLDELVEMGVLK